jgi:hypothetical protein
MCSLGDLKYVMENVYFPQEGHRNTDQDRFDTLCNCHRDSEFDDVLFLLGWLFKNTDKPDDFKLAKKMSDMISHKIVRSKCKGMSFYTIVPLKRLPDMPDNIKGFKEFAELMFNKRGDKYFNQVWYVIECGKHEDKSNLHIHILCDFKELGSKFFLRDLKKYWKNYFPDMDNDISYDIKGNKGIHRVDCNTVNIIKDKIDYMDNELKGSHENYRDLGLRFHHVFEV